VVRLLAELRLSPAGLEPVAAGLAALACPATLPSLYAAGGRLRALALAFLVRSGGRPEVAMAALDRRELEQVLGHAWLGVEGEGEVAERCLAWLRARGEQSNGLLASCVRWGLLGRGELAALLGQLAAADRAEVEEQLAACPVGRPREWPRLLVLVERPGPGAGPGVIRAYDFSSQTWSQLTAVPGAVGWDTGYSAAVLGETLVLTASNSAHPFLPVACLSYCPRTDAWSTPPTLAAAEQRRNLPGHATAALDGRLYSVLQPREGVAPVALHAGTPKSRWSVAPGPRLDAGRPLHLGPAGGRLVLLQATAPDRHHLLTYSPASDRWEVGEVTGTRPLPGAWAVHGGELVGAGGPGERWAGRGRGRRRSSGEGPRSRSGDRRPAAGDREARAWGLGGGPPRPLAPLARPRAGAGLGTARGLLWAAGGTAAGGGVEDSVEYYVPAADRWSCLGSAPGLQHPGLTVLEILKPLRLVNIEEMFGP
jgi:hypothetical protein